MKPSNVTERIREDLYSEFKDLGEKKGKLTDSDFDYYLARDRKASIILKTIQIDMQKEVLAIRKGIK